MTSIVEENGRTMPLDEALREARKAYLAGKKPVRKMTTAELEERRAVIREYRFLSILAQRNRGIEFAAHINRKSKSISEPKG